MKPKKIFKALAMVMLLPAMLLTTACSNDDDSVNNDNTAKKGYPLQVTVNVTRQGDGGTTRATYNESTRKLEFSAGDQLFVYGSKGYEDSFAGTLDYVPASGKFSGTIYTQKDYSGTAQELLEASVVNALLLPAGYDSYHFLTILNPDTYNAQFSVDYTKAFATSKATAVEQFSFEFAAPNPYSSETGFALSPRNPILNFTITGLTPRTNVTATLTYGNMPMISENVTTDGAGNATFTMALQYDDIIALSGGYDLNNFSLTVGSTAITLVSSSTPLTAGHIYNITRSAVTLPEGALSGKFTINASGKQVCFSKGNLQATYNGSSWSWAFATNQWDYIGNAEGNTKVSESSPFVSGYSGSSTTVDLFGWVGASSTWEGAAQYGITSNGNELDTSGYGTGESESLKSDWGKNIGDGNTWRTLTDAEWEWILGRTNSITVVNPGTNCRTSSTVGGTANGRYAMATVNSVSGLILFPDSYTHPDGVTAPKNVNIIYPQYTDNTYDATAWGKMESAGAVFLPAAGGRGGTTVFVEDTPYGYYWSSSPYDANSACLIYFEKGFLFVGNRAAYRYYGNSVRLVHEVE